MERAPARAALTMPCRPWAWAATWVPWAAASSTAAASSSSTARGRRAGPEGEHGPGGDHLDEVGPAVQDRPHPLPDLGWGGRLPEAEVAGQLDVGGHAGDGPPPPGTVT